MFCQLYYVPNYFESVKGNNPTITGVSLPPYSITMVPTRVIIGRLMTRFGRFRWAIWFGWLVTLLGTGLLILLDINTRVYAWVLIFVVLGIGNGLILLYLNFGIQAMADTRNVAYAAAMYTFVRTFGMCLGVAVGGAVFQNELEKHLVEYSLPGAKAIANNGEGFVATLNALPKDSVQPAAYISAYACTFRKVFEVLTAIAGFAGVLSLLIKEYSMDIELDSEHILRQGEKYTAALGAWLAESAASPAEKAKA